MSALVEAAIRLQAILWRETEAAGSAALPMLATLMDEKREAMAALQSAGSPQTPGEVAALRAMMAAAEENAFVLGAVAGALDMVKERLRSDLAQAADPGTYGPEGSAFPGPRKKLLRHTLAASLDSKA
jgi:hypothetical protein